MNYTYINMPQLILSEVFDVQKIFWSMTETLMNA